MDYKNLTCTIENNIATVTLNRPKALNALNMETLKELKAVFTEELTNDIRVVILTGVEKAFVAGADIKEMEGMDALKSNKFAQMGQAVFQIIESFNAPVIAAINGYALGGGCELALSCDIRLASEKAKFGQPEVNLGIIPGFGGTQRLPRIVGPGKAKELIYTGNTIDAAEALRIGLVNAVYPHDELMSQALQMAQTIASKGPIAVSLSKQAINIGMNMDSLRAIALEADFFAQSFTSEDGKEGLLAFVEKRKANFIGK